MLVGKKDSFVKVAFTHSVIIIWLEIGKNANFVNSSRVFILKIPSDFAMQLFVNEKPLLYQNAVAFEKFVNKSANVEFRSGIIFFLSKLHCLYYNTISEW